jgi:hypothetical protein
LQIYGISIKKLVENPEGKRTLGKHTQSLEDNIKIDIEIDVRL